MEIYLVRHGQTGGNVAHRHQAEQTPLTKEGRAQAELVVEKIKELNPTHLITSNLVRAIETARVIGEACDLVPETTESFIELVRPNHIYGRHHGSIHSIWYYVRWYLGRDTEHIDGGESYLSLRKRIREAQSELASYPDDAKVVVVTHSVFINMFVAHLCREKPLLPLRALNIFTGMLKMPNTHITSIKFDGIDNLQSCSWSVDR